SAGAIAAAQVPDRMASNRQPRRMPGSWERRMIDARSPHQRLSLRPATRPANRLAVWLMAAMLLTVVGCAKQQPTPPPAPPEPAVLTGTRATSNTSVIATFDRPVGAGATDVGLYT